MSTDWRGLVKQPKEWGSLKYDDPRYNEFADIVNKRYGLPPGMLNAVKNAGERSSASLGSSTKGARGLLQFMEAESKQYAHNRDNPFESIDAGGRYLADLIKENVQRYKNIHGKDASVNMGRVYRAAVANYNGGPKVATDVINGVRPRFDESADYAERVYQYLQKGPVIHKPDITPAMKRLINQPEKKEQ